MNKWRRERNYRKIKDSNSVVTYQITVDGETVAVTQEIYEAYSQMDRRERYQKEVDTKFGLIYIPDLPERQAGPEAEEDSASMEAAHLRRCLKKLSEADQRLIRLRYWEGMSQKEAAYRLGITQQAVSYREMHILSKLKALLEDSDR